MNFDIVSFIPRAVMQGIPLLYGSTGEILTEKSGNLNLGIPGIMYVGGICGVIGAFFYEQAVPADQMSGFLAILIPMLCSLLGSLLMGLLYCFLTVTLRANQNVTGLTMTTFGVGIGNFFGGSLIKLTGSEVPSIALSATSGYFAKSLPFAKSLGWFGQIFLSYGFLAYLAIILALLSSYFLKHTRPGLHLRSVGESASTADAAGINVTRYKYLATCVGSMIAGLGGLYYVMDYASGVWSNNAFGDRGWLAIALVIFTIWRPNVSVLASILFGGLYILYLYIPTGSQMAVKELYKMLPYVVTVVVLVIQPAQQHGKAAPCKPGPQLLPRGAVKLSSSGVCLLLFPHSTAASQAFCAAKPCRRADSFRPEENEIRVPCPAKAGQGIKAASCKSGPQLFPRGTVSCRFLSRLPCCFSPAAQPRPKRFAQQNLAEGRIHSARVRSALMEPLPSGECPIKDF